MLKIGTLFRRPVVKDKNLSKQDKGFPAVKVKGPKSWTEDYINTINSNTEQHGQFIEVDEKATEEYNKDLAKRVEKMEEEKQANLAITAAMAGKSLGGIIPQKKTRKPRTPKPENKEE